MPLFFFQKVWIVFLYNSFINSRQSDCGSSSRSFQNLPHTRWHNLCHDWTSTVSNTHWVSCTTSPCWKRWLLYLIPVLKFWCQLQLEFLHSCISTEASWLLSISRAFFFSLSFWTLSAILVGTWSITESSSIPFSTISYEWANSCLSLSDFDCLWSVFTRRDRLGLWRLFIFPSDVGRVRLFLCVRVPWTMPPRSLTTAQIPACETRHITNLVLAFSTSVGSIRRCLRLWPAILLRSLLLLVQSVPWGWPDP